MPGGLYRSGAQIVKLLLRLKDPGRAGVEVEVMLFDGARCLVSTLEFN